MALLGGSSATQYLGRPLAFSSSARPFTITGWFRQTAANPTMLGGLTNLSGGSQYAALLMYSAAGNSNLAAVADEKDSAGTEQYIFNYYGGASTVGAPLNVWWFGAVTYNGLSLRNAFLQKAGGGGPGINMNSTGANVASPYTHFTVGSLPNVSGDYATSAVSMAEICLWTTDLGLSDLAALAQGASPLDIGPRGNLLSYYPLRGDLKDYGLAQVNLQDLGTAAYPLQFTDHPPVMLPPSAGGKTVSGSVRFLDHVQVTTATTGTGPITTGAAIPGNADLSGMAIGSVSTYGIIDGVAWETGLGTKTAANVWTRTRVDATSAGTATPLSLSGNAVLSLTWTAAAAAAAIPTIKTDTLVASSGGSVSSAAVGTPVAQYAIGTAYEVTITARNQTTGAAAMCDVQMFVTNESGSAAVQLSLANWQGAAFGLSGALYNVSATVDSSGSPVIVSVQNTSANPVSFRITFQARRF